MFVVKNYYCLMCNIKWMLKISKKEQIKYNKNLYQKLLNLCQRLTSTLSEETCYSTENFQLTSFKMSSKSTSGPSISFLLLRLLIRHLCKRLNHKKVLQNFRKFISQERH